METIQSGDEELSGDVGLLHFDEFDVFMGEITIFEHIGDLPWHVIIHLVHRDGCLPTDPEPVLMVDA